MSKIHPHDKAELANLRHAVQALIHSKVKAGSKASVMVDLNGHRESFMRIPWDQDRRTENWHWSTLFGLVDGAGGTVTCNLWNIEDRPEAVLYQMAKTQQIYGGVGLLELFQIHRIERGVSIEKFGKRLGIVKSVVPKLESADDPRLGTLYRLARALDGQLFLGVGSVQ